MKRSEINRILRDSIAFMKKLQFALPPFAYWTPDDWQRVGEEADEIRDLQLGWDVTDFGIGDFANYGLAVFTIRNGSYDDPRYPKTYCEKIMISGENQVTVMHFHHLKTEDIINRGGGNLLVQLYNATPENDLADTPVTVCLDGVRRTVEAGTTLRLTHGESITLIPRVYHKFYGDEGKGPVLIGEVSKVNDDHTDNYFHEPLNRFPTIEEDEAPIHYLCTEYPPARGRGTKA